LAQQGQDLAQQWEHWRQRLNRRYKAKVFLAYLQSFSNTYGPAQRLKDLLRQLLTLPGLVGICVGTRPDCLDEEKLDILSEPPVSEVWLELGLQSANDQTLKRINRGHSSKCFAQATLAAARHGIKVCAHLIAGLPGEDKSDFLASVQFLNSLPVQGVKFHNLYICRNTKLALLFNQGKYTPLGKRQYCRWVGQGLGLLRPDIVVQRLNGDPAFGELLAPDWARDKNSLLRGIQHTLEERKIWQGQTWLDRPAPWFDPARPAPQGGQADPQALQKDETATKT
jgi:hypothetical protein